MSENPLLQAEAVIELPEQATSYSRKSDTSRRIIRDHRRSRTAVEAIEGLSRDREIYGLTKGLFSLADLLMASLEVTGPAHMDISTWTAASADLTRIHELIGGGKILSTRWLVDFSFQRRAPALASQLREQFGCDAVRVSKNHAKLAILKNDAWDLVIQTSMNLNTNPRFENFHAAHDPELAAFYRSILDEIWSVQSPSMALERPSEIVRHYNDDL